MASKHKITTTRVKATLSWPGYAMSILLLVILPLVYSSATIEPVIYPRLTGLSISLMVVCLLLWFQGKLTRVNTELFYQPFTVLLILYFLLTAASLALAVNPVEGLTELFKWALLATLFFLMHQLLFTNDGFKTIVLQGFTLNVVMAVFIGTFQLFNLTGWGEDPNALYEVKGLMAHKNQYSISLFLLLPMVIIAGYRLSGFWKKTAWAGAGGAIIIIVILQTRAVWLALAAGMILLLVVVLFNREFIPAFTRLSSVFKTGIRIFLGVFILVVLASLFFPSVSPFGAIVFRLETMLDPQYASNEWRLEMWDSTLDLVRDNTLLGVGTGNWKISIYPYYSEYLPSVYKHWRSPHNDYLWVASEKGIAGGLLYAGMLLMLAFAGIRRAIAASELAAKWELLLLSAGLLGFMVISFFSFPAERMMHWVYLAVYASFILSFPVKEPRGKVKYVRSTRLFIPLIALMYFPLHFGLLSLTTEIRVSHAQDAYNQRNWRLLEKHAGPGFPDLAPLEPRHSLPAITYKGLAQVHFEKDYQGALASFHKAYHRHPNHIRILNNLGSVYGITGNYEKSATYFTKTLHIFPHYEIGLLNLTKAYYKQENYIKAYQTILCCDPRSDNTEILPLKHELERRLRGMN